ncbi:flavin reductase/cob(II)yrinic acid a,c-diamide reductase [Rhodoblastus acidophilus]|uniref:Flavin reductase/cob(II)yrinic acid a,c-diamide reductase n=1 Tax=Rhodoblastus acidophilus TaxID=1074 RepID=A0A212RC57_RHOAC|nr:flavin reductase family protein [Rhodoblastus acidophilus]MCW2317199.1 flavin reductase (DIM6/NTAB) family NADH-FMN oxidoreductase RutF [Rhodoblastus acidophilus]SNB69814.1 flavin reductase/cob(II)yrinic acid a,c-diamide reductase [Rhodoblastus acidophilus]
MIDAKDYRDAMSAIASPVHIIATDGKAGKAGLTVTALASVTDTPATLLVCVNRATPSGPRFLENGLFSVNSLGPDDRELSDIFAGRTDEHFEKKFAHGLWKPGTHGQPALMTALACFECKLTDVKDVGTHHVFFGEVLAVARPAQGPSLIYHRRTYGQAGA